MTLISINSNQGEDLFKNEFPVLPAGKHLFVVANDLAITQSQSGKDMIKLEARCQDENENKGMPVFENFLIINTPTNDKEEKSKEINDKALAQFTVACGVLTQAQIAKGEQFDLASFKGKMFEAETKVTLEAVYPQELDAEGKPKKAQRASIKKYLFAAS